MKGKILKFLGQKAKQIICAVLIGIVVAVLLIVVFAPSGGVSFDAETSLREVLEISDLSTAEYTYNSIVEVCNEKEPMYYVSYEGKVRAGFDIREIEIVQNDETVTVIIPPMTIHTVEINENTLDYIFVKSKFDTETTFAEAINACKADLLEKAKSNNTFLATAKESAKYTIIALTEPFLSEVTIEIQFADDNNSTNSQEGIAQ